MSKRTRAMNDIWDSEATIERWPKHKKMVKRIVVLPGCKMFQETLWFSDLSGRLWYKRWKIPSFQTNHYENPKLWGPRAGSWCFKVFITMDTKKIFELLPRWLLETKHRSQASVVCTRACRWCQLSKHGWIDACEVKWLSWEAITSYTTSASFPRETS